MKKLPVKMLPKLIGTAILLSGAIGFSTLAQAATCPLTQTLTNFSTNPCQDADKLYTYISSDLPSPGTNISVEINSFDVGALTIHNFSINPIQNISGAGTYLLEYSVELLDPLKQFGTVSIDSDVPGEAPGVTVTKEIYTGGTKTGGGTLFDTLISTAGAADGPDALPNVTKFYVWEQIVIGANGSVNSFTDTYTERGTAPEPATLALLSVGLLGLGALGRRRESK